MALCWQAAHSCSDLLWCLGLALLELADRANTYYNRAHPPSASSRSVHSRSTWCCSKVSWVPPEHKARACTPASVSSLCIWSQSPPALGYSPGVLQFLNRCLLRYPQDSSRCAIFVSKVSWGLLLHRHSSFIPTLLRRQQLRLVQLYLHPHCSHLRSSSHSEAGCFI